MRARAGLGLLVIAAGAVAYAKAWRPWQLRWGATDEEVARSLPGDEMVPTTTFSATRAISIGVFAGQTVMTTFPRARPFFRYRMAFGTSLSG
jgi:hypothetical protein